jgi:SPP1 family holin
MNEMKEMKERKDYLILLAGFLGALKVFLASLGYDVLPDATIDSLVDMIGFGVALYAIWKNTYVSKKGKLQKEVLKRSGLE